MTVMPATAILSAQLRGQVGRPMTRAEFDSLCASHAGAVLSGPGELDAWKVGGKMFVCFGHVDTRPDNTRSASVKCPDVETANMLIDAGVAVRAPYFHRSWVRVPWGLIDADEMRDRLETSYSIVRSGLTKKFQATLAPWPIET